MLTPTYLFLTYLVVVLFFVVVVRFFPSELKDEEGYKDTVTQTFSEDGSGEIRHNGNLVIKFPPRDSK